MSQQSLMRDTGAAGVENRLGGRDESLIIGDGVQ